MHLILVPATNVLLPVFSLDFASALSLSLLVLSFILIATGIVRDPEAFSLSVVEHSLVAETVMV